VIVVNEEEEIAVGELKLFSYLYHTHFEDGFRCIVVNVKLVEGQAVVGSIDLELKYCISLSLCENVVSMQVTELNYASRKPKLELESINRNISSITNAFPELHFDEFDHCFYITDDDALPELTSNMNDIQIQEVQLDRRACNNCCIIL
jgi:hypothetical protein